MHLIHLVLLHIQNTDTGTLLAHTLYSGLEDYKQ